MLTAEHRRRVIEAMSDTQQALKREESYRHDLQDHDLVDFYRRHIAKLTAMLLDEPDIRERIAERMSAA